MPSSSISRIKDRQRRRSILRPVIVLLFILALAVASGAIWSFSVADRLMREMPAPLPLFNSNVMPDFRVVSFPSLDEQSTLYGWFLPAVGQAVSTVILVHDQGQNRLQFGLDTPPLYRHLVDLGLNVLTVDLRRSGQSGGELSGYGYAEWADVVASIRFVRRYAATTNVILYGFGTGVTAALIAWDQLPAPDSDRSAYPAALRALDFDQTYIAGLILDGPSASPDDYIRAVYRDNDPIANRLLRLSVPYAVRLSVGGIGRVHHVTLLSRCHLPVLLCYHTRDTRLDDAAVGLLVRERSRIHPDLTLTYACPLPGSSTGFLFDQAGYLTALDGWFNRFFLKSGAP